MLRIIGIVLLIAVFLGALVLAWLNTDPVEVRYLLGSTQTNLSFALFVALFIGWLLGLATSLIYIFRLRRELLRQKRQQRLLETEVNNLRSLPIRDVH